ncbi:hypothetical protein Ddye_018931 [Dipteronia dyeriana]|uniref:RING-CH-type domain-containing protein n=1 Tax=Dipteronia dyeriana TaxID=168575 RepID=A0AAD9TX11_9ROSI|nr:hypothetical protein Ddye_018931 [Dipteronia dyeriana]
MSPKKGYLSRSPSSHAQCRIYQQVKEEVLIDLGYQCRGGLAKVDRSCIDTWFRTRGSNRCEICQGIAANVPPPESQPSLLVLKKRATAVANAKRLMQNELDAMLDMVEPRPQGKLVSMRRRKFNLPGGPGGCNGHKKHQSVTPSSSGHRKISCTTAGDAIVDAMLNEGICNYEDWGGIFNKQMH